MGAGFRVAFHFDPLIYFPGWEEAYQRTVERLGSAVPSRAIAWISLGGLRLLPPLRQLMLQRFPSSRIAAQEMVLAPDGKLRYFKSLHVGMVPPHAGVVDPGDAGGAGLSLHGKPQGLAGGLRVYSRRAKPGSSTGWTTPAPTLRATGSSGRPCPWLYGPDLSSRGGKDLLQTHAYPESREVFLLQQTLDGLNPIQVLDGALPPVGVGAGGF